MAEKKVLSADHDDDMLKYNVFYFENLYFFFRPVPSHLPLRAAPKVSLFFYSDIPQISLSFAMCT